MPVDHTPRPASSALTPTGGFLKGFTHTLQPYIGCQFGCEYCYVKGLNVHRFHQPPAPWGQYAHPRLGIAERLANELRRLAARGRLDDLSIFMSSATDPYQALERTWRLSRACLDVLAQLPPCVLVLQTRSPFVSDDFDRLRQLGRRCWLSVTLETDCDEVRKIVTPYAPSIAQRLHLLQAAAQAGLNVQIAVSPCLPFSSVERFGALLLPLGQRIVIDTYASGDGMKGKRTAATETPAIYAVQNWPDWRSEEAAQALYDWLRARLGAGVGWSQAGFVQVVP
jgi:DNA repair photolyase